VSSLRVFTAADVERAVDPVGALEAVKIAFCAHANDTWTMPPKVYVSNYPAGDFRAMPALGGGHALLKWVTSFPGNPAKGLPTVTGVVVLSNAETGELEALLDAAAVTALRTGATAVLAAETLARADAESVAVIGAGVNGQAAARTFLARGRAVSLWDIDSDHAERAAATLGANVAASHDAALASDIVVTVTPGSEPLYTNGSLQPGQHVSLMGADGPGKAEIASDELARARTSVTPRIRLFCDDWEQASHSGDIAHAVAAGKIGRFDVTQLGAVLTETAPGRQSDDDVTVFDSTGLAIQDLAIAIACFAQIDELDLSTVDI
jgi:ornithine cyclodeaminase/alanine dehydrogenase-like protein (mu-crystallin family)